MITLYNFPLNKTSLRLSVFIFISLGSVLIIIPQALRTVFPVLFNEVISMVKDNSLAANITVAEMFMTTQRIVARTYEPLVLYIEVGVLYLIFSTILTYLQRKGETALSKW